MIVLRNKSFAAKKKLSEEDKKNLNRQQAKAVIGGGLMYVGGGLIEPSIDNLRNGLLTGEGELTGRVVRYHNTLTDRAEQIMKEGLRGDKTLDPDSYTNKVLKGAATKDGRPLVYTSTSRQVADGIGQSRLMHGVAADGGRTLELRIPYNDVKGRRILENPEQMGLSEDNYVKAIRKRTYEELKNKGLNEEIARISANSPQTEEIIRANYKAVDAKTGPTRIYEGNIAPEYIKGSKVYKHNSLREWGNYVKTNPRRFAKGVGKYIVPVAATAGTIGGGAVLLVDGANKANKIAKKYDNPKK